MEIYHFTGSKPKISILTILLIKHTSFRFPNKNDPLREKWVKVVRTLRQDSSWEPRENNRICSRHFPGTVKHYRGSHGKMVGSPVPSLFPRRSDEVTQEGKQIKMSTFLNLVRSGL